MSRIGGNPGNKGGTGNPGYRKLRMVSEKVDKFSEVWWKKWEEMIDGEDKQSVRVAMTEFNKLQCKMIPQDITSGGKELPTPLLAYVQSNDSDKEDYAVEGENTSSTRGDIGI